MDRKFYTINVILRIIVYIVIIFGAIWILIPFTWMILTSFKTPGQVFRLPLEFIPNPFTAAGYSQTFILWDIPRYFLNSVIVTVSVTIGSILICTIAGYAFAKIRFPFSNFLFYYILMSLMLPFQVRMIPTFLLLKKFGMLNSYAGLIVPWLATGFAVFFMRQMAASIPNVLLDAARIDGCSEFRIFWNIAVPILAPGIWALGIITFLTVWNDLLFPFVVISKEELKTLPLLIANVTGAQIEYTPMAWPTKLAAATVLLVPVFIVYLFTQRYIMKGFALHSGIK